MTFVEQRISEGIVRGTVGGPSYSTQVNRGGNGTEQRIVNWDRPLGKWDLGDRKLRAEQLQELQAFFHRVKGKAYGFRFRDWGDYTVSLEQGMVVEEKNRFYLAKDYGDGSLRWVRKPCDCKLYRNGAEVPVTLDTTTGEIVFTGSKSGLQWSGTFDIPVRFDTDELKYRLDAFIRDTGEASFYVYNLPMVELRL